MQFLDDSLLPETQEKLVITVAPYGPEWAAERLPGGPSADDGRARPEGGRLLQCRRHRAAHPCARAGRQGLQAAVQVQRAARPAARSGARHDPAGRRLDLLRARRRGRRGQVAVGRSPPHARRADAEAGPGDHRDQHDADEHHGPDDARRNMARPASRDPATYHAYREMVVPAGPEWVEEHLRRLVARRHPAAFPADQHARPRNGRAAGPARPLQWVRST